jgi:hypothetical protein
MSRSVEGLLRKLLIASIVIMAEAVIFLSLLIKPVKVAEHRRTTLSFEKKLEIFSLN